jgi:tRNA threonylcarbamoyladenosine modification (KEOPS) complex  Pcc1 subunit
MLNSHDCFTSINAKIRIKVGKRLANALYSSMVQEVKATKEPRLTISVKNDYFTLKLSSSDLSKIRAGVNSNLSVIKSSLDVIKHCENAFELNVRRLGG